MDSSILKNKRILLFAPAFFNYEKMMADKMREMGAEVDMYDVRSVSSAFHRALLKIHPAIFHARSKRYYQAIIERNKEKKYDFILIVKCDMTPICILKQFRQAFPIAKLCLYLYDSVKNIRGIQKKFHYFDTCHSFDSRDCKLYPELKLRPLFFADEFRKPEKNNSSYLYDICFLGTIHSDRFKLIRQIQELAAKHGLKCYWFLYLQSYFMYRIYKALKKEFKGVPESTFAFEKMNASDIADVIEKSRIVLDIQHPKQTGLTMRTIEMIGMNKKIITTNPAVKEYDFYNPNNIAVVDRNDIRIDLDFLKSDYSPIPDVIYEKYSLQSWVLDVLD